MVRNSQRLFLTPAGFEAKGDPVEKPTHTVPANAVEIHVHDGQWIVRLFAQGEVEERTFSVEVYAAGQRIRLGLHFP